MNSSDSLADRENLPIPLIVSYSLPSVGYGFMIMLFITYYMKFSTDVLYISPVVIGSVFGLARLWDAITDPVVGYWSDRTDHRLGRRRPWLLFSAVPIGLSFFMAFSPPPAFDGMWLTVWVVASIFAFYTAVTAFTVPHMSLGAELSYGGDVRNKLFGFRYGAQVLGSILGLWVIASLIEAEGMGVEEARSTATQMSLVSGVIMAILLVITVFSVRERKEFFGRGSRRPFGAFSDVFKNSHARRILFVTFVEYTGLSLTGIMALYVTEYVVKEPQLGPILFFVWMALALVGIPAWVRLSRRFKKRNLWITALSVSAISYGSLILVEEGDTLFMLIVMVVTGFSAACGGTIGPSTHSDIIDFDEFETGERKEGAYFACWNFVLKAAGGITILLAGVVLEWSGFTPKAEQSELVKISMLAYMSIFPMIIYLAGAVVLSGLSFCEEDHAEIRSELAARNKRTAASNSG